MLQTFIKWLTHLSNVSDTYQMSQTFIKYLRHLSNVSDIYQMCQTFVKCLLICQISSWFSGLLYSALHWDWVQWVKCSAVGCALCTVHCALCTLHIFAENLNRVRSIVLGTAIYYDFTVCNPVENIKFDFVVCSSVCSVENVQLGPI